MQVSRIPKNNDFEVISFLTKMSDRKLTSNEVNDLAIAILHADQAQAPTPLNLDLSHIVTLEQVTRKQLYPQRSRAHIITFGISYAALRVYDRHKAKKIIQIKQSLLRKYTDVLMSILTQQGIEGADALLGHLRLRTQRFICIEMLKRALVKQNTIAIKMCRAMILKKNEQDPFTAKECARFRQLWERAITYRHFASIDNDFPAKFNRNKINTYIADGTGMDVEISIEGCTSQGYTPLMCAIQAGAFRSAKNFLFAGANPDIRIGKYGATALEVAINKYYAALLEDPADPLDRVEDEEGSSDFVHTLISVEADPNIRDYAGNTAFLLAIKKHFKLKRYTEYWQEKSQNFLLDLIKTLIPKNADFNIRDSQGKTALMLVIERNEPDIAKALIKALVATNANLDIKDNEGSTALMKAFYDDSLMYDLIFAGATIPNKSSHTMEIFSRKRKALVYQLCDTDILPILPSLKFLVKEYIGNG